MTKQDLLKLLENCSDDARITVVDEKGYIHDAMALYSKAREGWLKEDEVYLRPA